MKKYFLILFVAVLTLSSKVSCQITLDSLESERLIDLIESYEIQKKQLDTLYKRYLFQDSVIYQLRVERTQIAKENVLTDEYVTELKSELGKTRKRRWLFGAIGVGSGILIGLLL